MFKNRISEIMKKRKKNLHDLVMSTDIPRTSLIRLTQTEDLGKISLQTLTTIAEALNCKVKDLFEKD